MLRFKTYLKNIVGIYLLTMFFACTNNSKEVKDFFAEQNLPIGYSKNVNHIYKDSGRITSKMYTPLLLDFSNRKLNPYSEFPEGIEIISFKNNGKDSLKITGDYAINYSKTYLSQIVGNVVITNFADGSILETEELYWDDKSNYFFTDKDFKMTQGENIMFGSGFESKQDLSNRVIRKMYGRGPVKE